MSDIRTTVTVFLNLPYTTQASIMKEWGYEVEPDDSVIQNRTTFFQSIKKAGKVDEFCEYVVSNHGRTS